MSSSTLYLGVEISSNKQRYYWGTGRGYSTTSLSAYCITPCSATRDQDQLFFQCWSTIADGGPTLGLWLIFPRVGAAKFCMHTLTHTADGHIPELALVVAVFHPSIVRMTEGHGVHPCRPPVREHSHLQWLNRHCFLRHSAVFVGQICRGTCRMHLCCGIVLLRPGVGSRGLAAGAGGGRARPSRPY